MKKVLMLVTLAFLLSGCELIGGYLEQLDREWNLNASKAYDILGNSSEEVYGKAIKALEVEYEVNGKSLMGSVSFLVSRGDSDDREKLISSIGVFLSQKYGEGYSYDRIAAGQGVLFGIGRREWEYYKDEKKVIWSQVEVITAQVEQSKDGIHVELRCTNDTLHDNGACDRELLEHLFEKNPVAALSPQAKKNWEELKARLN